MKDYDPNWSVFLQFWLGILCQVKSPEIESKDWIPSCSGKIDTYTS